MPQSHRFFLCVCTFSFVAVCALAADPPSPTNEPLSNLPTPAGSAVAQRDSYDSNVGNDEPTPLSPAVASKLQVEHHPDRLLVRFKSRVTPAAKQAAHANADATQVLKEFKHVRNLYLVEVPANELPHALTQYSANPDVAYAEPDYIVRTVDIPNDPDFEELWGMHNTGQLVWGVPGTPGADIRAVAAWSLWTGDPEFRIAVIDTGVNYLHPDLADNMWTNPGEIPGNGIDDDGNGWVDDIHGYDFVSGDGDPMADNQHGSHVAGTIGAVGNNGVGVVGVNWQCKIVALKFIGAGGTGSTSGAVAAMEYAVANGIRVSNNSWGGGGFSQAMRDIIAESRDIDHVFVAAAGNDGRDTDADAFYPASYDEPNIISVAATNSNDGLAGFSNYGLTTVDLGAPGVLIYSTVGGSDYEYGGGTSMASPHVAGVVALVMSRFPDLPWSGVKDRILPTVRLVDSLDGITVTGGVLNAAAAIGDCNLNGIPDDEEIAQGLAEDCNDNGAPDECDIAGRASEDCNENEVPDECDIADGTSLDILPLGGDSIPDECQSVLYAPTEGYPTIQSAIDAAEDNDFVVVVDGTHHGPGNKNLDLGGKVITVSSEHGPANCTIDLEGDGRGFIFHSGETATTRLTGLTIANGSASTGGGIGCFGSSPTIADCVITGNSATMSLGGGGIYCDDASHPVITNCIIVGNSANVGGGISSSYGSNPLITNCIIAGNTAGAGGGLLSAFGGNPTVANCTVAANFAGAYGGGLFSIESDATIVNSILWDDAALEGQEIYQRAALNVTSTVRVDFSDVAGGADGVASDQYSTLDWGQGNIGEDPVLDDPQFAGGPVGTWATDVIVTAQTFQTTLKSDTADWEEGELVGKLLNPETTQPLQFPVIANTADTVTVRCDVSDIAQPGGDFRFHDYHLAPTSPCINAGTSSVVADGSTDMDCEPREYGGDVDMGADEFVPQILSSEPPDGAIDARQPSEPDGANPTGWGAIDITFDHLGTAFEVTAAEIEVTETGGDESPPDIAGVEQIIAEDSHTITVTLADPIEPGAWTCFTHQPSGTGTCLGYLPADADGDGTSSPADILALVDALNNVGGPHPVWSSDIDRDGDTGPADILRLIDLLNGAAAFDAWLDRALP